MEYDEVSLLEVLKISAEDLVEAFEDRISARMEEFNEEYDENDL